MKALRQSSDSWRIRSLEESELLLLLSECESMELDSEEDAEGDEGGVCSFAQLLVSGLYFSDALVVHPLNSEINESEEVDGKPGIPWVVSRSFKALQRRTVESHPLTSHSVQEDPCIHPISGKML